ncbi:DUF3662 and FHA domain-containing protein [Lysinibacter sp. HNR]|uniref:FhaA domain-containing protein n=1 Tax=Lysinibacter sp. HNR TaxID=3031408 RepID=UPI00243481A2|nr:DUF3662 and FHA domain-containing protein [Lysinibacter sp. HNR]WGD37366.1 DUF3662 and FHA domain-containing protein [Lysinibacter sp. HNR]
MGILENFERGLERVVNSAFAKTFRSGLQPVEIAAALRRELDVNAVVVDRDRTLAPNSFVIRISPQDYKRVTNMGETLRDELLQVINKHAKIQGYQFAGPISLKLKSDTNLSDGILQIDVETLKGSVSWSPVLDIDGKRHPITKPRTVIGRGRDADITLNDTGTSRKHIEIVWDGRNSKVRDLGSTNGTKVNGNSVSEVVLEPNSEILIGQTRIIYRVLPQATSPTPRSNTRVEDKTVVQPQVQDDFWRDL